MNNELNELKPFVMGITKGEIASRLDRSNPLFAYTKDGMTNYRNYSRDDLLKTCIQFEVSPLGQYQLDRMQPGIVKEYRKKFPKLTV